jgi:hypothetical protein
LGGDLIVLRDGVTEGQGSLRVDGILGVDLILESRSITERCNLSDRGNSESGNSGGRVGEGKR